ncbi:hypothetical protein AN643_04495 [Candidatus Epulonipiscioides saccharophilum]|nr:hypothetical protein AN643_04495 [Epulopiscium sp. SCG-B10WGA-EpuloB]
MANESFSDGLLEHDHHTRPQNFEGKEGPEILLSGNYNKDKRIAMGLLEHDHYTRPKNFEGKEVPEILLSGNHKKIEEYRRANAIINTLRKRPDLLNTADLTETDKKILKNTTFFQKSVDF